MNGTLADARRWAEGFAPLSPALEGVETVVCAPTLHLPLLHASLPESVRLGAEDVSATFLCFTPPFPNPFGSGPRT